MWCAAGTCSAACELRVRLSAACAAVGKGCLHGERGARACHMALGNLLSVAACARCALRQVQRCPPMLQHAASGGRRGGAPTCHASAAGPTPDSDACSSSRANSPAARPCALASARKEAAETRGKSSLPGLACPASAKRATLAAQAYGSLHSVVSLHAGHCTQEQPCLATGDIRARQTSSSPAPWQQRTCGPDAAPGSTGSGSAAQSRDVPGRRPFLQAPCSAAVAAAPRKPHAYAQWRHCVLAGW